MLHGKIDRLNEVVHQRLASASNAWQTALFVSAAALIYFVRAKEYVLRPQLYAEDGGSWLQEGYNHGLDFLWHPYNGFLHLTERLFGWLTAQLPLQWAPFLFNLVAGLIFVLLAYYLFSPRTKILANNYERIFLLLCLGLIANVDEFFFNFSNSVFLLGIIGLLIIIAKPARSKLARLGEKLVFVLTCFTLPFAWFYLPLLLIDRFKFRIRNNFFLYTAALASAVQLIVYVTSQVDRSAVTLFSLISKYTLLEIHNQIIVPTFRLARIDTPVQLFDANNWYVILEVLLVFLICVGATILVLKRAKRPVWYLLLFLALMTFASIKSPTIVSTSGVEVLRTLSQIGEGDRYFIYGIIGLSIVLVKFSQAVLAGWARLAFMTAFISFGLLTSLHYDSFHVNKQFADLRQPYRQAIDRLKTEPAGTIVLVPTNPPNEEPPYYSWTMTLKAK